MFFSKYLINWYFMQSILINWYFMQLFGIQLVNSSLDNQYRMGNNPTKSQQLTQQFPQYKILPQLCLQLSNIYQLIYVTKLNTNQIFLIKESIRDSTISNGTTKTITAIDHENVLSAIDSKFIDNMQYTLYEWMPTTLLRFIETNPALLNRSFALYILNSLISAYTFLSGICNAQMFDIVSDNIRAGRNASGKICIKVYPPQLTCDSVSQRKTVYNNEIKHLGQVLFQIFKNKHRQVGQDIINFIVHRIQANNTPSNLYNWQLLQKDCQLLSQPNQISVQQLNDYKYPRTPQKISQKPISPIIVEQRRPNIIGRLTVNEKSFSPLHNPGNSNINIRDHSPNISKLPHQQSNIIGFQTISYSTIPRNSQLFCNQTRSNISNISPIKQNQSKNNGTNQWNRTMPYTSVPDEQRKQKQNLAVGQKTIHQFFEPMIMHQNGQMYNRVNPSPIKLQPVNRNAVEHQRPIEGQRKDTLSPSPMRYYHTPSNASHLKPKENVNIQTSQLDSTSMININNSTTPRQRNFNINDQKKETQTKLMVDPKFASVNPNIRIQPIPNTTLNTNLPTRPSIQRALITKIDKQLPKYSLFEPSARDSLQIRPLLGVPSSTFIPQTHEDRHDIEERNNIKQSNQSSLNLQCSGEDFMEKHLMVKNKQRQLLGSSIPVISADKSSSFGLTVSEDSFDANFDGVYEGIYEGTFHPNHPTTRHGVGRLVFPSGGSYQGGFVWNKMEGWGKLFYPSGRLAYEGYWKQSKFQGYGKLFNQKPLHIDTFDCSNFVKIQQNNDEGYWKYYEGNLKNDMKQGHGVWVLQNGQKYDGEFHKDMVHGPGIFYGKKESVQGRWEKNILVQVIKIN